MSQKKGKKKRSQKRHSSTVMGTFKDAYKALQMESPGTVSENQQLVPIDPNQKEQIQKIDSEPKQTSDFENFFNDLLDTDQAASTLHDSENPSPNHGPEIQNPNPPSSIKTSLAGANYYGGFVKGNVSFLAEPENLYDRNAVKVIQNKKMIGHLPRTLVENSKTRRAIIDIGYGEITPFEGILITFTSDRGKATPPPKTELGEAIEPSTINEQTEVSIQPSKPEDTMELLDVIINGNYLIIKTDQGDFKNRIDYAPPDIIEKCKKHIGCNIELSVRPGTGAGGKTWKELGWFVNLSKASAVKNTYKNRKTVRVLGGPGCGKTYQMMKIVRRALLAGIKPEEICFMSFTNVAVDEAIRRVREEIQSNEFDYQSEDFINFSTVHKLADKLGRLQGERMDRSKFKKFEPILINHGIFADFGYETVHTKLGAPESITERIKSDHMQLISYSRATGTNYSEVLKSYYESYEDKEKYIKEALLFKELYEKFKQDNKLTDFDDSIESAINSDRINFTGFKVIIIDEAQDLSLHLWKVVTKVINNSAAAVICGDPDQAIMDVFGASSKYFEDYPVTSEHVIKRSRRLPKSHFNNLNAHHQTRTNHTFRPLLDAIEGLILHIRPKTGHSALAQFIDTIDPVKEYLIMSPTKISVDTVSKALYKEGINHFHSNVRVVSNAKAQINIRVQTIWTSKGAESDNVVLAFLRPGDRIQYRKYPKLRYVAESRSKESMTFLGPYDG
jgi:hypothetical protein